MESLKERNVSFESKKSSVASSTIMLTLNSKLSVSEAKMIGKYQRWVKL